MNNSEAKILLVEDEEMIRINLEDFFEDEGREISSAESGEEALKLLKEETFDIVITDMGLPGIDGNEFIRQASKLQPQIHFIVLTGSVEYYLPEEFKALNIKDNQILNKPLKDMMVLNELIESLDLTS